MDIQPLGRFWVPHPSVLRVRSLTFLWVREGSGSVLLFGFRGAVFDSSLGRVEHL